MAMLPGFTTTLKTGKKRKARMAKEIIDNGDGTKSIERSISMGAGDVPVVRMLPDMGLKKGDMVIVTMDKKGNVSIRKKK
jgi:hypothetical protein